jgi:hypothetical protein
VDDALSIKGPNKQAVLSLEVTDTADAVAGKFEALGALVKKIGRAEMSTWNPRSLALIIKCSSLRWLG